MGGTSIYGLNSPGKKRKREYIENEGQHAASTSRPKKAAKGEEKRKKRFRSHPPASYLERLDRVRTQRMFLIDRQRTVSDDGLNEEEVFDLAGSTGNVYSITIGKLPRCTCPDNRKGNQCKHIIYVSWHISSSYSFSFGLDVVEL